MKRLFNVKSLGALILLVLVTGLCVLYNKRSIAQQKVSAFGKYEGYGEAMYNGSKRMSDYLTLSNGTRLAYDLILPTQ